MTATRGTLLGLTFASGGFRASWLFAASKDEIESFCSDCSPFIHLGRSNFIGNLLSEEILARSLTALLVMACPIKARAVNYNLSQGCIPSDFFNPTTRAQPIRHPERRRVFGAPDLVGSILCFPRQLPAETIESTLEICENVINQFKVDFRFSSDYFVKAEPSELFSKPERYEAECLMLLTESERQEIASVVPVSPLVRHSGQHIL